MRKKKEKRSRDELHLAIRKWKIQKEKAIKKTQAFFVHQLEHAKHLSIQYCYLFLKLKILPRWQTIVPRGDRHSPKRQNANYYLKELET